MRRSLLTVLVAAAVMPIAADAIAGLWTAVNAPSAGAAVHAAAGAVRAAVALWLAVTLLSWGDEPRGDRLRLYDWRVPVRPFVVSHERMPHGPTQGDAR